tara:strand:- start:12498 stop:13088 length:591 start_codon:yes stop_codon:yes gene_type:complete
MERQQFLILVIVGSTPTILGFLIIFTMSRLHLFILAVLIIILGFLELLVFDEEVLLALCFVCFIFFAYSSLNLSVSEFFEERSAKFESDLILAFDDKFSYKSQLSAKLSADKVLSKKLSTFTISESLHLEELAQLQVKKLQSYINVSVLSLLSDTKTLETRAFSEIQSSKMECTIYSFLYSLVLRNESLILLSLNF